MSDFLFLGFPSNFLLYCFNIFLYPDTQHIVVENENETQYIVFQKRQAKYLFL